MRSNHNTQTFVLKLEYDWFLMDKYCESGELFVLFSIYQKFMYVRVFAYNSKI